MLERLKEEVNNLLIFVSADNFFSVLGLTRKGRRVCSPR